MSEIDQQAVRADFWDIFDIDDQHAAGEQALAGSHRRAWQFEAAWGKAYPGAVGTVIDSLDDLVAHLHYPRTSSGPIGLPRVGSGTTFRTRR